MVEHNPQRALRELAFELSKLVAVMHVQLQVPAERFQLGGVGADRLGAAVALHHCRQAHPAHAAAVQALDLAGRHVGTQSRDAAGALLSQ